MEKAKFSILWSVIAAVLASAITNVSAGDVVYAVNAGGDHHVDLNGIHYLFVYILRNYDVIYFCDVSIIIRLQGRPDQRGNGE